MVSGGLTNSFAKSLDIEMSGSTPQLSTPRYKSFCSCICQQFVDNTSWFDWHHLAGFHECLIGFSSCFGGAGQFDGYNFT